VCPESVVEGQSRDLYHDMSWAKRWHVVYGMVHACACACAGEESVR
jgi:hypothetical protein